jgi:hypothetical protein
MELADDPSHTARLIDAGLSARARTLALRATLPRGAPYEGAAKRERAEQEKRSERHALMSRPPRQETVREP